MFNSSFTGESFSSSAYSDTYSNSSIRLENSNLNYTLSTGFTNHKYCTPRTISTVESIKFDDDDIFDLLPSVSRANIWCTSSDPDMNESLFTPFSNSYRLTNTNLNLNTNGYREREKSVSSMSGSVSPIFNQNQNQNQFTYSAAARQGLSFVSPRQHSDSVSGTNFLTFRNYKGAIFTVPKNSKFFVIKSYNILDVTSSFTHNIWTSTELGNRRLDRAFHELKSNGNYEAEGKIFLLFSVNSSGKFCGVAEMKENIDFNKSSDIWVEQTRWKGIFPVEWLLIKDVPNRYFQHLKIPSNEYKPVTNSKDTQEIPFEVGISMLKIICSFRTNSQ
ncbi:YT521-B-like domain-containing protein [Scheffersomyces coipomensis]|uniref:YT521-B-like domain-containing protein n=1 Tax=Scheffersomyces coipomensis TaxID=1788519 RepID=UPI00315DF59B